MHPELKKALTKADAFMLRYPTICQYGEFHLQRKQTEFYRFALDPVVVRQHSSSFSLQKMLLVLMEDTS